MGGCAAYETQTTYYQGSHTSGTLLKTANTTYSYSGSRDSAGGINVVPTIVQTVWPNGQKSQTTKAYDSGSPYLDYQGLNSLNGIPNAVLYGKVVTQKDYDYPSGTSLLRTANTTYAWQVNSQYLTSNLLNLPVSVTVAGGNGYLCAETDYAYDTPSRLYTSGVTTQHTSPPGSVRGNIASVTKKLASAPCSSGATWSSIPSYINAYDTGTVYQSIDPNANTTTYTYDSTFAGAYATQTQLPNTNVNGAVTNAPSPTNHITKDWYDFNTGLKVWHEDENSQKTSFTYDAMSRIVTITPPAPEGATTFTYTDTPGSLSVQRTQTISGAQSTNAYALFDGLGRQISHVVANDQVTPYDRTDTCYDARGLKSFASYPYQTSTWSTWAVCPSSQPGDSYAYDAIKRQTSLTHSDSTAILSSYTGRATSVTDEGNGTKGVQRISQIDGLGRLVSICEVTSTTLVVGTDNKPIACGQDIAGTGFLTAYGYDPLGNLLSVSQGSGLNPRSFTYDSLSRLIAATNPESGTTCYGNWASGTCVENYDADSNLLSRTRPAANQSSSTTYTTTTYTYDPLNRPITTLYSDGTTPQVAFYYDQTSPWGQSVTNPTGRLAQAQTENGATLITGQVFSYDAVGHVANSWQCTPSVCGTTAYYFTYGYDGVGDLTSSTDNGDGITYTTTYNIAARPKQIASTC